MIQFYFLSIVANMFGGALLAASFLDERVSFFSGIKEFAARNPGLRVGVGITAVLVGVLKLLSATSGDVPVVGDLIPALGGLIVGSSLLFERYKEKSSVTSNVVETGEKLLMKNRTIIGLGGIVIGFLHFLLPRVLFL